MVQFGSDFLAQFPPNLQAELRQFTSLIDGWEETLGKAPQVHWPQPRGLPEQFDHYLEFVWQANTAKAVSLCRGIVQSLSDANFLSFAVLFRAFFEQVLLLRAYWARLLAVAEPDVAKGRIESAKVGTLIQVLHSSVRRSRVDWEKFVKADFSDTSSKNAMDEVGLKKTAEAWQKAGARFGVLDPMQLYDVLCDLGHPNFGSAIVCMRSDSFGFVTNSFRSVGLRVFGFLYPSLVALATQFQGLQDGLIGVKGSIK